MKHDPTLYEPPCRFCEISSIAGAIIGGGASIIGGLLGSDAAEEASDAQVRAAEIAAGVQREGLAFSKEVFDVGRADTAPYRATGTGALGVMNNLFLPGGQTMVDMQERLNELRARQAVLARTGAQATTPEQAGAAAAPGPNPALASPEWWRTVRTSRQWDPGGDGSGAGGGP